MQEIQSKQSISNSNQEFESCVYRYMYTIGVTGKSVSVHACIFINTHTSTRVSVVYCDVNERPKLIFVLFCTVMLGNESICCSHENSYHLTISQESC